VPDPSRKQVSFIISIEPQGDQGNERAKDHSALPGDDRGLYCRLAEHPRLLDQSIKFQFKIDYLDFSRESRPIPVIFVVPLAFVAGLILMYLVNLGSMFRLRRRVKSLEKSLRVDPGLQTEDTSGASAPEPT